MGAPVIHEISPRDLRCDDLLLADDDPSRTHDGQRLRITAVRHYRLGTRVFFDDGTTRFYKPDVTLRRVTP